MMKTISKQHFARMEMICSGFLADSKTNSMFIPEYKSSIAINEIIRITDKLTLFELKKIEQLIESINWKGHNNGSRWFDYMLHLNAVLKENGFESDIL